MPLPSAHFDTLFLSTDFMTFEPSHKIQGNFKNSLFVLFAATKLQKLFE